MMDEAQNTSEAEARKNRRGSTAKVYRTVFVIAMIGLALILSAAAGWWKWHPEIIIITGFFLLVGPSGLLFLLAVSQIFSAEDK